MRILILSGAMLAMAGCCFGGSAPPPPVNLAPGFTPQPTTANGTAGGINEASSLNAECRGRIPLIPQHTINVTAQIPALTVMVNGGTADTTLVIGTPTGTYLCNDDSGDPGNSLNPSYTGAFAPGTYMIYVGSFNTDDQGVRYTLGFTEAAGAVASSLPAPS